MASVSARIVTDGRRTRVFAIAAAALLAIALVAVMQDRRSDHGPDERPQHSSTATIETGPLLQAEPDKPPIGKSNASPSARAGPRNSVPAPTRGEREAGRALAVAPREARAATAAARAFLDGYLPYSYGLAAARRVRAVTARLLRELAASPPRVPAAIARARPRVISVRAQATTGTREVIVRAVVDDGQRRYGIPLAVRDTGGGWLVAAVTG